MDNSGKNKKNDKNDKRNQNFMTMAILAMVMMFAISFMTRSMTSVASDDMSYNEFLDLVKNTDPSQIVRVEIDPAYNKIVLTMEEDGRKVSYETGVVGDIDELSTMLLSRGIEVHGRVLEETNIWYMLSLFLPIIIIVSVFSFMMRKGGGGIMGVGKSNAKIYMQKETGVTFKDVAGQDEAEESLVEIVDFLHNPGRYAAIGAKLPKGALLVGPPGTGKTLLAKAVAGEAKVPFFSLAGSDFVEMFVGVGASRVRDLFKQAQQQAPCIIFIDEIDAIGKTRDTRFGGNDEREQTLNQLLAEMDGFDSSKGVFILAATNRPEVLDPALCRPGRLDRRIIVDKPDMKGRVAILKVHSKNVRMDDTVDLDAIGMATAGAVGSDLANMINEAAILAVKNNRQAVSQADLFESVEVVIAGKEKKDRVMNDDEKKRVAYHEVGHALAAALQKNTEPVQKITIVPRTMGSLGYTMQMPEEERFLQTQAELEADLVIFLAGRAAEQIFFDSVSTGAANDIERATRIARAMVTRLGMSAEFGLMGLESVESQYLDGRSYYNCGEQTVSKVDAVVMQMLKDAYNKALQLIGDNKYALERIAAFLIEKETITGKEFMKILGEVQEELRQLEQQALARQEELKVLEENAPEAEATGTEPKVEVAEKKNSENPEAESVVEIHIAEKTVTEE